MSSGIRAGSFGTLSHKRRHDAWISVKNQIRKVAPEMGGRFFTHDLIHGRSGWIDLLFLGKQAPVYYNVTLETAVEAYKEAVWDRAWAASYELSPLDEPLVLRFVPDPETGDFRLPLQESRTHKEFGGLTRMDWTRQQVKSIADSGEVGVQVGWTLLPEYRDGIGLSVTLDVPAITTEVIHDFMDRFLANPVDWREEEPRSFKYDQIPNWGARIGNQD